MIAVDTSALMATVLNEAEADLCAATLADADRLLISAGTLAETLIVARRRGVGELMEQLIDGLGFEIVGLSLESARRVAAAYERWGKGRHPAALNFGDCFAYAVAEESGCALLFVGEDFAKTDMVRARPDASQLP